MECKHLYEGVPGNKFTRMCKNHLKTGMHCEGYGMCVANKYEPEKKKRGRKKKT